MKFLKGFTFSLDHEYNHEIYLQVSDCERSFSLSDSAPDSFITVV